MNEIIQNILVGISIAFALSFLIKKFFWKKSKPKKACGSNTDGCGCH
ncbi:FeoB-associated Cys-rich membrane protein [Algibacter sp. PT7-4]